MESRKAKLTVNSWLTEDRRPWQGGEEGGGGGGEGEGKGLGGPRIEISGYF